MNYVAKLRKQAHGAVKRSEPRRIESKLQYVFDVEYEYNRFIRVDVLVDAIDLPGYEVYLQNQAVEKLVYKLEYVAEEIVDIFTVPPDEEMELTPDWQDQA